MGVGLRFGTRKLTPNTIAPVWPIGGRDEDCIAARWVPANPHSHHRLSVTKNGLPSGMVTGLKIRRGSESMWIGGSPTNLALHR